MILWQWRKRPDVLVRRLQRAEKKLLSASKDAAGTLARTFQRDLDKRVKAARTVSGQDSPDGHRHNLPNIKPFRVELRTGDREAVVKLDLRGHHVAARTRGVQGALRYLGLLVAATWRRGLWLNPRKKRGVRARNDSGPTRFFAFSSNPRLRRWAADPAKGMQSRRHVLLLTAKMLQALLMGPTLRKNEKKVRAASRRLTKAWSQA